MGRWDKGWGKLRRIFKLKIPLIERVVAGLVMLFATTIAYCADENFMLRYACVESNFHALVPPPKVIDREDELNNTAIRVLARDVPREVQLVLAEAANLTISSMGVNSRERIDPDAFYEFFVINVGEQLGKQFVFDGCGKGQDQEVVLYNVGINRYFAAMVGKGKIYQWFDQHGGPYTYPAWVAAVVALELTGRSPDLKAWKKFYEHHTKRFRRPD